MAATDAALLRGHPAPLREPFFGCPRCVGRGGPRRKAGTDCICVAFPLPVLERDEPTDVWFMRRSAFVFLPHGVVSGPKGAFGQHARLRRREWCRTGTVLRASVLCSHTTRTHTACPCEQSGLSLHCMCVYAADFMRLSGCARVQRRHDSDSSSDIIGHGCKARAHLHGRLAIRHNTNGRTL
jgi:hypothetical protein